MYNELNFHFSKCLNINRDQVLSISTFTVLSKCNRVPSPLKGRMQVLADLSLPEQNNEGQLQMTVGEVWVELFPLDTCCITMFPQK